MQEKNAQAIDSLNQLNPDDSVPTLDSVRAKIEKRYADALGAQELQHATGGDRINEIQAAGNDMKATARPMPSGRILKRRKSSNPVINSAGER